MAKRSIELTSQSVWQKVQVGIACLTGIVILVLLTVVYLAFWEFIASKPPNVARVWAIVASTLIPVMSLIGGLVGLWLGIKKADWTLEGMTRLGLASMPLFKQFGVEAADVRIYAGRGLGMLRRESRSSQELFLPSGAVEIMQPVEQDTVEV